TGLTGPPGQYTAGAGISIPAASTTISVDFGSGATQVASGATVAALQATQIPVGGIIAWHRDLPGVPALPENYIECNGQEVTDSASPLYTQHVPDLNSQVYAGGRGRYLRGGTTSGTLNASSEFTGNANLYMGTGGGGYYGACYGSWINTEHGNLPSYSTTDN